MKFDPYLVQVKKLAQTRKVSVFLVGGFLRDLLLKRNSLDLDFAVERNAITFAKVFARKIKGAFVLLDEEHGCARVARKSGNGILTFDFADFRDISLKNDLKKRDFTVNTFALNMKNWKGGDLTDILEDNVHATKDLDDKITRMVSPGAFKEDPLRLLRAFAMRAALGFTIEKKTLDRIRKDRELIRNVSAERVREELFKILETERCAAVLKAMDKAGLLEIVIPQIRVMFDVKQGSYHHLNVWPHSLETVRQMDILVKEVRDDHEVTGYLNEIMASHRSRKAILKLACLLHDIGKPQTRRKEGERIRFHGHEHAGVMITNAVSRQLKLSTRERHVLADLVQMHLRPGYLSNFKKPSEKSFFRYFRDAKEEAVSTALLSIADQRSTKGPLTADEDVAHHDKICRELIRRYFEQLRRQPFVPLINGDDLIQISGLKPSPLFSKILKEVAEAQATGEIATKEQALIRAGRIAGIKSGTGNSEQR
ncbi:MAG: HD domain-containing protein [Candidatus Omnitrophota bacterium]